MEIFLNYIWVKASLLACLYFLLPSALAQSSAGGVGNIETAYDRVLNLQLQEARGLLTPDNRDSWRVLGLCDALELLVNEDESLLKPYEEIFESRMDKLSGQKNQTESVLYTQAELALLWSFVYLKFGREFDAAFQLRRAHRLSVQCKKKHPTFLPILKTHGLLQIILGSVPEKYTWMLGVLNMKGDLQKGLAELDQLSKSDHPTATEATIILSLVHGYVLQQPEHALSLLSTILEKDPTMTLALFTGASVALKNAEAEKALVMLRAIRQVTVPSVHYFLGEALLCKGEYETAAESFEKYIQSFKGQNFIKDAHFKTGLCYQLLGNPSKASQYFQKARQQGHENTEADKYAGRALSTGEPINSKLFKIRFFTDGGYYDKARNEIQQVTPADLPTKKELIEFYYRQARLAHKTTQWNAAKLFYTQTIDMCAQNPWYFAPNACLQLGYIHQLQGDKKSAREYFQQALSYKKHEYKNSIDAKAKSALAQLNDRK